jgi:uncharacterized membrane protein
LAASKLFGAAALIVFGAVAGYVLMALAPQSPWTLLAMLGPMSVLTFAWLWGSGRRLAGLVLVAALAATAWALHRGTLSPQLIYVAQHAGIHLALAAWFASTLSTVPLIVQVASRVHAMSPAMVVYATHVTRAWAIYFVVMALLSIALYAWAPFSTWNLFATVLTPCSVMLMFVTEYLLRYRLHPEFERVPMRVAIHAWRQPADALPDTHKQCIKDASEAT